MATKDRCLGHLSKPPKPAAPDPGRNMHPGARVTHQDAIKVDPTRPAKAAPKAKNSSPVLWVGVWDRSKPSQ